MKYLLLTLLWLSPFMALANNTDLTWTNADTREDGTVLLPAEIAEHKIYYGTATGDYQNVVNVPRDAITGLLPTSYSLSLPTGSTYFFVVTTVDTDGRESQYSAEVSVPLDHYAPNAPTGVMVIEIKVGVGVR